MGNQLFEVALKAFITQRDGRLLLVQTDTSVPWELPGGRISAGEEYGDLTVILRREIEEEIGRSIQLNIGNPVAAWVTKNRKTGGPIFLVGYHCDFVSGEIELGGGQQAYQWVTEEESRVLTLSPGFPEALQAFWNILRQRQV